MDKATELTQRERALEGQLQNFTSKLAALKKRQATMTTEMGELAYTVQVEGDAKAKAETRANMEKIRLEIDRDERDELELLQAVRIAQSKLKDVKAQVRIHQREAKQAEVEKTKKKWLVESRAVQRLVIELAGRITKYEDAKAELIDTAYALGDKHEISRLTRKNILANYIHAQLAEKLPHDFFRGQGKIRSSTLLDMDTAVADAILGVATETSRKRLEDNLAAIEDDLKGKLSEQAGHSSLTMIGEAI